MENNDNPPPPRERVQVRPLTEAEQARFNEALSKLKAPHQPGEPLDVDAFHAYRLARLRADYPDVAAIIGCD